MQNPQNDDYARKLYELEKRKLKAEAEAGETTIKVMKWAFIGAFVFIVVLPVSIALLVNMPALFFLLLLAGAGGAAYWASRKR